MKPIFLFFILLLLTSCSNQPPKTHKIIGYDEIADQITAISAKNIEKQTGLCLIGTGGGSADNHLRTLNMSFQCYQEIDMDQARHLVITCVNVFLSAINASEKIKPFLIHHPFTPKDIEIRIFIQKSHAEDVALGGISVVSEIDGNVIYKVRDPDPVILKIVLKETFEKALSLVIDMARPVEKQMDETSHRANDFIQNYDNRE